MLVSSTGPSWATLSRYVENQVVLKKVSRGGLMKTKKYDPKFCDFLIDHMSRGYSYESFAANVNVGKSTLYYWENKHPEWKEAKEIGWSKSQLFWEQLGKAGCSGQVPGYNNATWIFTMKNRFGYRDEHHLHSNNTNVNVNLQVEGKQKSPVIEKLEKQMLGAPPERDVTPVKIDARQKESV